MASIAAFVYFWSSAYEVSGGCATDTLYPSFLRMLATASQPEPSAKAPCTRTTFLICCFTTILLCSKDPLGSIDLRCRMPSHQTAPVLRAGGSESSNCLKLRHDVCTIRFRLFSFSPFRRIGF